MNSVNIVTAGHDIMKWHFLAVLACVQHDCSEVGDGNRFSFCLRKNERKTAGNSSYRANCTAFSDQGSSIFVANGDETLKCFVFTPRCTQLEEHPGCGCVFSGDHEI